MRLARASSYAIFALVYLARSPTGVARQGREIAESCGMPAGRLLKILQQLVRSRFLSSERGPAGGFRLRKPPGEITLLEVIEALEGPVDGELPIQHQVPDLEPARAALERACRQVADYARKRLQEITIRDLLE